jgi:integrating conjugative element protein (TIGR03761 family)
MISGPLRSAAAQEPEPEHRSQRDPAESPIKDPGALRGSAWLTLQTRHAGRLVKGRPGNAGKPPIIGLLGFAYRLRVIWQGARTDDPYAEWWLVKVDRVLAQAAADLEALRKTVDAGFASHEGLEIDVASSVQPTRVELQFANPYAYRGAQLLGAYDGCVRRVLSAQHVGLVNREETERYLNQGAKPLRRAFDSALGYRLLGITRAEIEQQTAKAKQALESMGELPPEILSRELHASLVPKPVVAAPETAARPRLDTSAPTQ